MVIHSIPERLLSRHSSVDGPFFEHEIITRRDRKFYEIAYS